MLIHTHTHIFKTHPRIPEFHVLPLFILIYDTLIFPTLFLFSVSFLSFHCAWSLIRFHQSPGWRVASMESMAPSSQWELTSHHNTDPCPSGLKDIPWRLDDKDTLSRTLLNKFVFKLWMKQAAREPAQVNPNCPSPEVNESFISIVKLFCNRIFFG